MDVQPLSAPGTCGARANRASPDDARPLVALAETCRVIGHDVPLWPLHRERLSEGGCGTAVIAEIERELARAIAAYSGERTSRLRAHLEVPTEGPVAVEVVRRLSSLDVVRGPIAVPVRIDEIGPPPEALPGGAKPADRTWWDKASIVARRQGGHQAIIVDTGGRVVDGSSATIWSVIGGRLITPPAPFAVAGVARRLVLDRARRDGIETEARPLWLEEALDADELFLTNAFGGAVAVRGRGGPMTALVRGWFAEVWRRTDDGPPGGTDVEQGRTDG